MRRALLTLLLCCTIAPAKAEFCLKTPDPSAVEKRGGYRWLWRYVDQKKCWYYSNMVLPREELIWSFSEEEFNADINRILERKIYKPQLDENGLLIEAPQ